MADYRSILIPHLEVDEGVRLRPYRCSAGALTIGIGRNIDERPLPKAMENHLRAEGEITPAMVYELLDEDLRLAEGDARYLFPEFDRLSTNRKAAVVELSFNLGRTRLAKFKKFLEAARVGDWRTAGAELRNSRWHRQVQKERRNRIVNWVING